MRILVTGGPDLIVAGVIPRLLKRGHVLVQEAADDCDAVLHMNTGGTRNLLAEAERAHVRRFVFVSSHGDDPSEDAVRASSLAWTIVRPGSVYGPGDEVISPILKMVRALPVVPVIDGGNHELQPVWYEDLGRALAAIVERDDLTGRTLELAGREVTSMNDLLERFRAITGRKPLRIPVPESIASLSSRLESIAAGNILDAENGFDALDLETTPLDDGLRLLADALPEVMPHDGVGALERKHFWADIRGSRHTPVSLMTLFRERLNEMMPLEFSAEPGTSADVEQGKTLTLHLPLRGNSQVRAEVVEPTKVVFVTIEGHPLAGMVQFFTDASPDGVRFHIEIFARASNPIDWIAVHTIGKIAQPSNWRSVVQRVVDASGGTSDGVHQESRKLDDDEARETEERIKRIVEKRQRDEGLRPTS